MAHIWYYFIQFVFTLHQLYEINQDDFILETAISMKPLPVVVKPDIAVQSTQLLYTINWIHLLQSFVMLP